MSLDDSVAKLPQTAPQTIRRLAAVQIYTIYDLLNYFPIRYQQYPPVSHINDITPVTESGLLESNDVLVTYTGTIINAKNIYARRGITLQKCTLADDSGAIELVWFNQPYILSVFQTGRHVQVAGKLTYSSRGKSLHVTDYDILNTLSTPLHTAGTVPVYSEKKSLSTRLLREKIRLTLQRYAENITEILPADIIKAHNLIDEKKAYQMIHFPSSETLCQAARHRLAFDEMFSIQLASKIIKKNWVKEKTDVIFSRDKNIQSILDKTISSLPFTLTSSQQSSFEEILQDLMMRHPMNRLLQGEVGSGKTIVAALACLFVHLNGYKSLLMAPTEILAEQHYNTLQKFFGKQLNTILLTSNHKTSEKHLESADVIVGTHALIGKKKKYNNIGLVVIDEQHKFGVSQRAELKKKGINPHLLTMTATPIPRTVLLTLYKELDVSVISELPSDRLKVKTYVVPRHKRDDGYKWMQKELKKHNAQAFIVCPFVDESAVDSMKNVKAAKTEFDRLSKTVFPHLRLGLLHGKLKSNEKSIILDQFSQKEIDILVTTPVVEVGIDFPNATIIVIEAAERFGLAQLHQLRGRVGRGDKQSHCLLFTETDNEKTTKRLNVFARLQNGIELAEYDLKMRGAGELYGTRQHGFTNLKIASLSDFDLIASTDRATDVFLSRYALADYPVITKKLEALNRSSVSKD